MVISHSRKGVPTRWCWNCTAECKGQVWVRKHLGVDPPLAPLYWFS